MIVRAGTTHRFELRHRRLDVARFVDRAAHDQTLIALPLPHVLKAHVRLGRERREQLGRGPTFVPPSVLTSTRVILPRPLHAIPVIGHQPGPESFSGYAGDVMIDFASISKLNMRAFPPGSGSVYFDVSHRVMNGSVAELEPAEPFHVRVPFLAGEQRGESEIPARAEAASPFCA